MSRRLLLIVRTTVLSSFSFVFLFVFLFLYVLTVASLTLSSPSAEHEGTKLYTPFNIEPAQFVPLSVLKMNKDPLLFTVDFKLTPRATKRAKIGEKWNNIAKFEERKFILQIRKIPNLINNFYCSVEDKNRVRCRELFDCKHHSEQSKQQVPRTKPVEMLRAEEASNQTIFEIKRGIINKVFPVSKQKRNKTIQIINRNIKDDGDNHVPIEQVFNYQLCPKRRLPRKLTKKQTYIKELSMLFNEKRDDVVAYLHYKLKPIVKMPIIKRLEALNIRKS